MFPSDIDFEDYRLFHQSAMLGRARRIPAFAHLDQPIGIWNYIRIASEISAMVPRGKLLDWGCGYGQMTYLLRRRGFDVVPFDVVPEEERLPDLPFTRDIKVVCTNHRTQLPFDDQSFDAVLSCGVLEHVDEFSEPGDEERSLREIRRVLKPGGYFPIYHLPQRWAWKEAMQRVLRLGYAHPRRFAGTEIRAMLQNAGFQVVRLRRNNVLPQNLTGLPQGLRDCYYRLGRGVLGVDCVLSRIPVLNLFAGDLEVLARR